MSDFAWESLRWTSHLPGEVTPARDWDALTYDRISDPQVAMAGPVLDRLELSGDETVLDAGCGSGRVTRLLLDRLSHGHVVAVDASPSMVEEARATLGDRVTVIQSDLLDLTLPEPVDAAFSNAVFHWVLDHQRLFDRLHEALKPGGQLVAQCGGQGNIDRLRKLAAEVAAREPFATALDGWADPWNYASPEETETRLANSGFTDVQAWLEPWPVDPPEPREYLRAICLGHHIAALPNDLRDPFLNEVTERYGEPTRLDYIRLNITARRPANAST